jgi:hypothetical protein
MATAMATVIAIAMKVENLQGSGYHVPTEVLYNTGLSPGAVG